jgi:hypothetical protein
MIMQTEIINTVKDLFSGADERDWKKVKGTFANEVLLDYSVLSGNPATTLTPDTIITAWKGLLPGFDKTKHQPENFTVKQDDDKATVHYFAKADHFLGGDEWTVEANYDTGLIKLSNGWKINSHKISNVKQSGNVNLPAQAMKIVKNKK